MSKYSICVVVILLLGAVVAFFVGDHRGRVHALDGYEPKTDTIVKTATVYKDFPDVTKTAQIGVIAVPRYKFIVDTITATETAYLHDTTYVFLPREQKYYEEDSARVRIWVSGYEPCLDRYEVDYKTVYVTQTLTKKPPRWGLGISAGFGATISKERVVSLAPYIGIGLQYNLVSW